MSYNKSKNDLGLDITDDEEFVEFYCSTLEDTTYDDEEIEQNYNDLKDLECEWDNDELTDEDRKLKEHLDTTDDVE